MKKQTEKIIYGVYYRKSSEDDNKQVNSIKDQKRELDEIELKENLNIAIKFPGESQTAFSPGRPVFDNVVQNIESGKINALFTWHANRISRNPIDAGRIIYLMDTGKLVEIKTPSRIYRNNSNDKFMLQLDFSMSKKDSDDKSDVVKRALKARALRGLPNGVSKIGYLNDKTEEKGNRKWIVDDIRFPLVEQVFRRMLTGKYSVPQIYLFAKNELKLATLPRRKEGGKPLSLSYIYNMFRDPIFAGFFFQNEQRCELDERLPRVITEEEYWGLQTMLGSKGVKRTSKRDSLYNHFAKCGVCNGATFPDFKFQIICSNCHKKFSYLNKDFCPRCNTKISDMSDPNYLSYVFYYCINDKKHRTKCPGNGLEEKKIDEEVINHFEDNLQISKELSEWCIDNISKIKDKELGDQISIKANFENEEQSLKTKLKNIAIARISRDMSQDEEQTYNEIEKDLKEELNKMKAKKENMNIDWFSEASKDFSLMSEVIKIIKDGTREQKKDVLFDFGSNLTIKDKKVIVHNKKSLELFSEYLKLAQNKNKEFEPKNSLAGKEKTEVFASVIPTLLPIVYKFRTLNWNNIKNELQFSGILNMYETTF